MFHKEFYPTPIHVLHMMGIDAQDKICLEPHAGKGDIVDYLQDTGASRVIACELNDDLRNIVANKAEVIGSDFFDITAEQISHVQLIVMNPPFSNAVKHIIHAFEIAPEGCEIISLCNHSNFDNSDYTRYNRRAHNLIRDYGTLSNLGDVFSNAERTTHAETALVKLYKPIVSGEFSFEGFDLDPEEELQENGMMAFSEVRAIVNRYVASIKCFDKMNKIREELKDLSGDMITGSLGFQFTYNETITNVGEFSRKLQKNAWDSVIKKLNVEKYVTSGVKEKLNKFVEQQHNVPFTVKNVHQMINIIVQTRVQNMEEALVAAVDSFTKHTHENRFDIEGWKTNESYLLNKKFIIPYGCKQGYHQNLEIKYSSHYIEKIDDLIKVLCYLKADNFDDIISMYNHNWHWTRSEETGKLVRCDEKRVFQRSTWYEFSYFRFKMYNKGSIHFEFLDTELCDLLNSEYGRIKGFSIPAECRQSKTKRSSKKKKTRKMESNTVNLKDDGLYTLFASKFSA